MIGGVLRYIKINVYFNKTKIVGAMVVCAAYETYLDYRCA